MQLDGPFASGGPADPAAAVAVLRATVAAGIDHIDTAQYYGAVNDLIREALYPYSDQLAIISKVAVGGGLAAGSPSGESRQLRAGIADNLRSLRVGQLAAVGLSNVSLRQLRHAAAGTDIVCVQNLFHLADRSSTPVLRECLSRGIAFVRRPLGAARARSCPRRRAAAPARGLMCRRKAP
jgi:aryl-alcohol dehydrogenase-like predicted oxidoreductase